MLLIMSLKLEEGFSTPPARLSDCPPPLGAKSTNSVMVVGEHLRELRFAPPASVFFLR